MLALLRSQLQETSFIKSETTGFIEPMSSISVIPAGDLHPTAIVGPRPTFCPMKKLLAHALSTTGFVNDKHCDSTKITASMKQWYQMNADHSNHTSVSLGNKNCLGRNGHKATNALRNFQCGYRITELVYEACKLYAIVTCRASDIGYFIHFMTGQRRA
jgi:hypothetical protein